MHFRELICYSALATLAVVPTPGVAKQVPAPKWDKYARERQGVPAKGGFHGHQAREAEAADAQGWNDAHGQPYDPHAPQYARDAASTTAGTWAKPSEWASWLSSQLPKVTGSHTSHPTAHPSALPPFASQHGHQHGAHHARDAKAEAYRFNGPPSHYENHGNAHHARDAEAGHFTPPQHYQAHNSHHAHDAEAEPVNFPAHPGGKFEHASDWHKDFLVAHGVKHTARDALADEDSFEDNVDFSNDGYAEAEDEDEHLQAREAKPPAFHPQFNEHGFKGNQHHARDASPEPDYPAHPDGKEFDHNSDWHKAFLAAHGVKHNARDAEPEAEAMKYPAHPDGKFDHASDWHKEFLAAHGVMHNARSADEALEFEEETVDPSDEGYELHERDVEEAEPLSYESYGAEDEDKLFARDARNAFQPGSGAHPTVNADYYDSHEHVDFLARHGIKLTVPSSATPEATETPSLQARSVPPKPKQHVPTKPAPAKPSKVGFGDLKFPW
ncbi:hypothetical protein B0A48_13033 [Cryoendolithus antarcticus]|uniref:Uncharacterized protein n=1 Tax=Cryoendolithus antarcticus TaxID=1507870 RepID=A0A1V8SR18_9PEZI|nr:hypothetical protein B0A48_13033 [Cryoendolithus antarcticus]